MANEMTSAELDSVQCPVCFKDFRSSKINRHLDACLLNTSAGGSPSTEQESEPPPKKSRIGAEAAPPNSSVNRPTTNSPPPSSSGSDTPSSPLFSLFQANKSKNSAQNERSGVLAGKQAAISAVNKGLRRDLQNESDPGPAGTGDMKSQQSGSNEHNVKTSNNIPPRALLSMDKPLAEVLRPNTLEEYFGQSKVVGHETLLRSLLESQDIPSLILWGPPGCGKVSEIFFRRLIPFLH